MNECTKKAEITRDAYSVISTALPAVNYVNHMVKTYTRRHFKSYPVAMNNIVLTSPAMGLFDVIENVMSAVLKK